MTRQEPNDLPGPDPVRDLYAQIDRGGTRPGIQLPGRAARVGRGVRQESGQRGLDLLAATLRRWRLHRRQHGPARLEAAPGGRGGRQGRLRGGVQGRSACRGSLMDFSRMMEVFDRRRVSFVSVSQQFNSASSMGRLTMNLLLTFAQFERELISERTRDKMSMPSRRKGKYVGRCAGPRAMTWTPWSGAAGCERRRGRAACELSSQHLPGAPGGSYPWCKSWNVAVGPTNGG